jgi:hypothetical protein
VNRARPDRRLRGLGGQPRVCFARGIAMVTASAG